MVSMRFCLVGCWFTRLMTVFCKGGAQSCNNQHRVHSSYLAFFDLGRCTLTTRFYILQYDYSFVHTTRAILFFVSAFVPTEWRERFQTESMNIPKTLYLWSSQSILHNIKKINQQYYRKSKTITVTLQNKPQYEQNNKMVYISIKQCKTFIKLKLRRIQNCSRCQNRGWCNLFNIALATTRTIRMHVISSLPRAVSSLFSFGKSVVDTVFWGIHSFIHFNMRHLFL